MDVISHTINQDQKGAALLLAQIKEGEATPALEIKLSGTDDTLKLSEEGSVFLLEILAFLADGKTLTIAADDTIITVEEAAKILNVSPEYVIKLIEEDKLIANKSEDGYHLLLSSVIAHDEEMKKIRKEGLAFLTAEAQKMNLY